MKKLIKKLNEREAEVLRRIILWIAKIFTGIFIISPILFSVKSGMIIFVSYLAYMIFCNCIKDFLHPYNNQKS